MGAMDFWVKAKGATAKEAFATATSDARHEYGHGGYTGTIAEKSEFKMVTVPAGRDPSNYAEELMQSENHFCGDKWGPAACVKIAEGEFLFFGCASS